MEEFIPPPEAPVFQPSLEEFKDPVAYISKIRPVVVNTGICKIRPPAGWKPPFAVDIEKFTFTPRLQPLNELEAKTRVKLNFLESLAKFWELQGIVFKIPNVDRHPLDLHGLYKVVSDLGGYDEVCSQRKWSTVAKELNYFCVAVSGSLKINYEKYLHPYVLFLEKHSKPQESVPSVRNERTKTARLKTSTSYEPPVSIRSDPNKNSEPKQKRRTRSCAEDPDYSIELDKTNPEFKKLAFTAPGPKNSFAPVKQEDYRKITRRRNEPQCTLSVKSEIISENPSSPLYPGNSDFGAENDPPQVKTEPVSDYLRSSLKNELTDSRETVFQCGTEAGVEEKDPVEAVMCVACHSGDCDDELLLCDGCDDSYHMFCLDPPLSLVPPGDWRCPSCLAEECNKPQDAFGFEQAEKQYNLRTYGEMANTFKRDYFNKSPHEVPYSAVEKEFWRLVSSIEDEVVVEYGADLHTSKVGSGFPWQKTVTSSDQVKYANSLWNLNRMPNADGCVLKYIDADISGMKVPWAYVGMCFSCFCWHIEDHWSYSINYLHWGEPKTWYGVPSAYAESLEATMKQQAPELFENHPDLMHDLVTTLSPSVLMKNGIPVVRTDQCAGEFVVTFPRAYHAGFNQGFNFAEAVNFSLADWISMGRLSIDHYQSLNRAPVFSHDELICKMMACADSLDLCLLEPTCRDAAVMVNNEQQFRDSIANKSYVRDQRELFELVKDEERQCALCNTYCFLSAVKCSCGKLACPRHIDSLCQCPDYVKVFQFRYTLPELRGMLTSLQSHSEAYISWVQRVETVLDPPDSSKTTIQYLKELYTEANNRNFTRSEICDELLATLQDVQKGIDTALQINNGRHRTRSKMLDVNGLREFLEQVDLLPCHLPQADPLRVKIVEIEKFQATVASTLNTVATQPDTAVLQELINTGEAFEVFVPEVKALKLALQQATWISETVSRLETDRPSIDTLRTIVKLGSSLSHGSVLVENTLTRVKNLLASAIEWDQRAKDALKQRPPHNVDYLQSLLDDAESIPVMLALVQSVRDVLAKAENWTNEANKLVVESDANPQYTALKTLLDNGRAIPVTLEAMPQVESCYTAAKAWYDRATRAFMKKNCTRSLLEVLLPRSRDSFFSRHATKGSRKKPEAEFVDPLADVIGDPSGETARIHEIEEDEKTYIAQLRTENNQKTELDENIKRTKSTGPPILYCFCQKPESGYMLQCELCHEWYHGSCLRLPKGKQEGKWSRFLCSFCQRTKRPKLDTIVSLLISLQKVPVSFTEGAALQCLAERAVSWQKKARKNINNVTLLVEAARTQRKRVMEIKANIARWRTEAQSDQTAPASSIQAQLANSAGSVLNHYESELQRLTTKYAGLNAGKRAVLDNLLMEGDLLEVTMDEAQQLWDLLNQDAQFFSAYQKKGEPEEEDILKTAASKPAFDLDKRKRKKRREPSPALSTSSTLSPDKGPPNKKLRSLRNTSKTTHSTRVLRSSTPVSVSSQEGPSRKTREMSSGSTSSNEGLGCREEVLDAEEESECSAAKCRQPVAEEIAWVQCDTCQGWFHCLCVGLTKESAEQIESYLCINCKSSPQKTPRKGMLQLRKALQNVSDSTVC